MQLVGASGASWRTSVGTIFSCPGTLVAYTGPQLASDLLVRFPLLPLPTFSSYLCLLPKGELWPKVSVLHLGESTAFWSK